MTRPTLNRGHKALAAIVIFVAVVISGIGFAGSYTAVRALAARQGFGWFAAVLPIGVDVGIVGLYALDLLLTWLRMPYPLLRQAAWFLTGATIVMNAASAWPHPLGLGMHAVIPILFIVMVEAGRHAVGRWANLIAGKKQMEGFTLARWILAPLPTFLMWRRKHLWGIYLADDAIELAKQSRILRSLLRRKYGWWGWRRATPELALQVLHLARFGEGKPEDFAAALAAAGIQTSRSPIEVSLTPALSLAGSDGPSQPQLPPAAAVQPLAEKALIPARRAEAAAAPTLSGPVDAEDPAIVPELEQARAHGPADAVQDGDLAADEQRGYRQQDQEQVPGLRKDDGFQVAGTPDAGAAEQSAAAHGQLASDPEQEETDQQPDGEKSRDQMLYDYYCAYVEKMGNHPGKPEFAQWIYDQYGVTGQTGGAVSTRSLDRYWAGLTGRYRAEAETPKHPELFEQLTSA